MIYYFYTYIVCKYQTRSSYIYSQKPTLFFMSGLKIVKLEFDVINKIHMQKGLEVDSIDVINKIVFWLLKFSKKKKRKEEYVYSLTSTQIISKTARGPCNS